MADKHKFNCPHCHFEQEWEGQTRCVKGCWFSNWFRSQLTRVTGIG